MATSVKAPRSSFVLGLIGAVFLALFAGLIALGAWQVQRLGWKRDLIQRVESRVHAEPGDPPAPAQWPGVSAASDEYRHVRLRGRWLPGADTRVQAVTDLGPGFWLLSPLRTDAGYTVLVNRGYVPDARAAQSAPPPPGEAVVTGLLRLSEPGGGFLRDNQPWQDRWFSRDVAAIAAARKLDGAVAPYFVDAERAAPLPGDLRTAPQWPVGGLTVIKFPDHHLQYALTWFALALMVLWAGWRVWREEARRRAAAA
ncbi:SURF1 family protein [Lysobacter enzymogenes]|uniref:SURF1 family protein n=1 Tax=Lysobacter enzymogenes TaxID=69 RepID=UPI00099C426D|nr:SURF1 family protein [Lysobacter enzymogenes]UZW58600.1 SURF1 family protein [Lysobacter enzymogenes]